MAGLGFKKQFGPKILDGSKVGTIRANRKRPIKVGERLYLFTGMRTKNCQRIGEKTALHVVPIKLLPQPSNGADVRVIYGGGDESAIAGRLATRTELDHFAVGDGFASWDDLCAFWHKEHPESKTEWFSGTWILWSAPVV